MFLSDIGNRNQLPVGPLALLSCMKSLRTCVFTNRNVFLSCCAFQYDRANCRNDVVYTLSGYDRPPSVLSVPKWSNVHLNGEWIEIAVSTCTLWMWKPGRLWKRCLPPELGWTGLLRLLCSFLAPNRSDDSRHHGVSWQNSFPAPSTNWKPSGPFV